MRFLSLILLLALYPTFGAAQLRTINDSSVKVRKGTTLSLIANLRYGSRAYAGFLQAYNDVDPNRLQIGTSIDTPDFLDALRKCGTHEIAPTECESIAKLIAEFRTIEVKILMNRFSNDDRKVYQPLDEGLLKRMSELASETLLLADMISKALHDDRGRFCADKLREAAEATKNISAISSDTYALDNERVHRRFDSVLQNLVSAGQQGAHKPASG